MSSTPSSMDASLPLASPSPPMTAPSRRQSCDRCHSQKLRCSPVGTNRTGACSRCYRHGTQCVYSLSRPKGRPSLHYYKGEMVLMPPKGHGETLVQPLTLEEYGGATIQEPGMTHSLQLTASPQASEAIAPCQPESDPISAPGPYLELMPEAWGDCALQPDVYWWDTMHVRCQATGPSVSKLNAPTAVHLGFHDFGEEICVPELQGDWHLETRDNLSTMGQPSLYSYNNPIKILGHLTPRAQALSNKSREVFENRGSFHKQGDIDLRFPPLLQNDAVFKLVMTWLFNPSEDMNDECSIFNSLSTTTDELRNEEVVVELVSCSSKFATTTLSLQEELGSRTNKAASDENVAHHLVAACHALLLDSFGAVLGALQGAADADRHAVQGTMPSGYADLRLAMVVQLCSYMFVRQCRVVDAYLEAISGPNLSAWSPNKGSQDRRVIQELKARVDRRFAWFQTLW